MDGSSFDTLVRLMTTDASRRELLAAAGVSALGAFGLASLLEADEAEAKQGGRKRRRRRCKPKPAGALCETNKDCCTKKTKRICGSPFGASITEPKVCCGEAGTPCKFNSDCCRTFFCPTGSGKCELE